jgi:hypothetical protein
MAFPAMKEGGSLAGKDSSDPSVTTSFSGRDAPDFRTSVSLRIVSRLSPLMGASCSRETFSPQAENPR